MTHRYMLHPLYSWRGGDAYEACEVIRTYRRRKSFMADVWVEGKRTTGWFVTIEPQMLSWTIIDEPRMVQLRLLGVILAVHSAPELDPLIEGEN